MEYCEIIGILCIIGLTILLLFSHIKNFIIHLDYTLSDKTKWWLMLSLGIIACGVFIYSCLCSAGIIESSNLLFGNPIFFIFFIFLKFIFMVFPFIVWGIIIAGFVMKHLISGKLKIPKSVFASFALGAILPMCSCGVIPIVKTMLTSKDIPVRSVITFLMVTPVLNPFVVFLSYTVLGWKYLLARIIAIFVLSVVTGIIFEKFFNRDDFSDLNLCGVGKRKCDSRNRQSNLQLKSSEHQFSVLLYSYDMGKYLLPHMIIGITISGLFKVFFSTSFIIKYLSSDVIGLLIVTIVGVPIFICSGEKILILKPLMDMGLPLGHAIAFTLAGSGISATSIVLLLGVLKKRATAFLIFMFCIGTFVISLTINILI